MGLGGRPKRPGMSEMPVNLYHKTTFPKIKPSFPLSILEVRTEVLNSIS